MYNVFDIDISISLSSAAEGQFSKLKDQGPDLPLRADKMVLSHLSWLEGEINYVAPKLLNKEKLQHNASKIKQNKANDSDSTNDSLNEKENWFGKIKKKEDYFTIMILIVGKNQLMRRIICQLQFCWKKILLL